MNKLEEFYRFAKMMFRRVKNLIGNRRYLNMLDGLEIEYIAARGVNKFSVAYMSEWKQSLDEISQEERQNFVLIQAIKFGDLNEITELVEAGANINNSDSLLYAVLYGRCEAISFFIMDRKTCVDEDAKYLFKMYKIHPNQCISRGANHVCDILDKEKMHDSLSRDLKPKIETSAQIKRVKL